MAERRTQKWKKIKNKDTAGAGLANISAAAVAKRNHSAGIAPAGFKSVRNVLKKINGA